MSAWNKGRATVFGAAIFAAITQAAVASAARCESRWPNLNTCTTDDGSARAEGMGSNFAGNIREVRVSLRAGRTATAAARGVNGLIIPGCTTDADLTPANGGFEFASCTSEFPPATLVIIVN